MNISDIFYVRHSDIGYSFNMMSHLGVRQSLFTTWKRQNNIAQCRNVMAEVKSFAPCTWTFLWDNFNKTHGSHSVIYGDSNTHSVEVISRAALALPPPKFAQIKPAKASVKIGVIGKKRECQMKLISTKYIYINMKIM